MDYKPFKSELIYFTFFEEYLTSRYLGWDSFIKSKDFGILVFKMEFETFMKSEYIVVDEKKWLVAKIKYGF
jgi:hypothetical protein